MHMCNGDIWTSQMISMEENLMHTKIQRMEFLYSSLMSGTQLRSTVCNVIICICILINNFDGRITYIISPNPSATVYLIYYVL